MREGKGWRWDIFGNVSIVGLVVLYSVFIYFGGLMDVGYNDVEFNLEFNF